MFFVTTKKANNFTKFFVLFIIGIIISLLSGTNATGPVLYTIDGLGMSISGVILGFLYFSPIKKEFEK